jgi:hypothetical protein
MGSSAGGRIPLPGPKTYNRLCNRAALLTTRANETNDPEDHRAALEARKPAWDHAPTKEEAQQHEEIAAHHEAGAKGDFAPPDDDDEEDDDDEWDEDYPMDVTPITVIEELGCDPVEFANEAERAQWVATWQRPWPSEETSND